ncbi:hypothetical protein H5410_062253 [Solanum commersonii]|uniref:Uncharacterized protein n=1 Tax=Solanum commersonii TaxID=4109 RepID=A0A9J5WB00_SOLCO|nr:hypothetical protein H5410_062253 [Solanum commersonii]
MTKRFSRMLKIELVFQRKNFQKPTEKDPKEHEIKNDKYIPTNRRLANQDANLSVKKAFAATGNQFEEESKDGGSENQSLLPIEETDKYEFLALVALEEAK